MKHSSSIFSIKNEGIVFHDNFQLGIKTAEGAEIAHADLSSKLFKIMLHTIVDNIATQMLQNS